MASLECIRLWSTTAASIFIAVVTGMGQLAPDAAGVAAIQAASPAAPIILFVKEPAR